MDVLQLPEYPDEPRAVTVERELPPCASARSEVVGARPKAGSRGIDRAEQHSVANGSPYSKSTSTAPMLVTPLSASSPLAKRAPAPMRNMYGPGSCSGGFTPRARH